VEFFLREPEYAQYWELLAEKQERYKTQTRALRELMGFAGKRAFSAAGKNSAST
jgi:hypothetical protein